MQGISILPWRKWTEADADYLRRHTSDSVAALAAVLGRTSKAIESKLSKLGLRGNRPGAGGFAQGHTPWNAGLKGYSPAGSEHTRFAKGQVPAHAHAPGTIIQRCDHGAWYHYLKLPVGKCVPLHVHRWQQQHGPVPAVHVLRCRTADTLNAELTNWELVSRWENARRNQIWDERSAARQLSDRYVAFCLSRGERAALRPLLVQRPQLLHLKRLQLRLNREILRQNDHA